MSAAAVGAAGPVRFCGLELAHPIVNGSGTFDALGAARSFGADALRARLPFAAFFSKTVTVRPRDGNPPPRLWELGGGLINSIGLPNRGLDRYIAEELPELAQLGVPLVANVMGFCPDEFAELVERLAGRDEVAALELNVSCPNVESGLIVGADPSECGALVARVRPLTTKPLVIKLTPNAGDVPAVARAAEAAGADALCLINTLRGMALTPGSDRPWLGAGSGGVSGPAVRAPALLAVSEVSAAVAIPVIGMGGVARGGHALELLRAGATLVGVGTESFRDPLAAARIRAEMGEVPAPRHFPSISSARG